MFFTCLFESVFFFHPDANTKTDDHSMLLVCFVGVIVAAGFVFYDAI